MNRLVKRSKAVRFAAIAALMVTAVGCGRSDLQREVVAGVVTYQGKPVPQGRVHFEPAEGSVGPQGTAEIVAGRFRTDQHKGPVAGSLVVQVEFWLAKTNPPVPSAPVPDNGDGRSNTWQTSYRTMANIPVGGSSDFVIDIPISVKPGDGY